MDILELHTSPVKISPPKLVFFQSGDPSHPQTKKPPQSQRSSHSQNDSRWKIKSEKEKGSLRLTLARCSPKEKTLSAKQEVRRAWEKAQIKEAHGDPESLKRPKPPRKRSPEKHLTRKSFSPRQSPKEKKKKIKTPKEKAADPKKKKKEKKSKQRPLSSEKRKSYWPSPTRPGARPSTYKTPKRYRPSGESALTPATTARRVLF
ncbi:protein PXR1 [Leptopilina heterotoma]|uniref:protein PXR1 n=1 Tax=Leptopilina heterotoma TaxID=63436 RepID=UPI001CA90506|nr:protein PXR1 [Leptopilina heterotoma]